jgi:CheY-like chemotaxis protein
MAFPVRVRVVLADDDREIISAVRSTLGERAHIIAAVDDGKHAVLAALEFIPDLLITDLAMPFMDGLQVAIAFQRANWGQDHIADLTRRSIGHHCVVGCGGLRLYHKARRDLETAVEEVLKGNSFRSDPSRRRP